jgi:hypothetical protein
MGSIVAYDVLRDIGRSEESMIKNIKVEHFVTLGSPLGLTPVKGHILKNHNDKIRTPSCVNKNWKNFSDPQDLICFDSHLSDDYAVNSMGISVTDILVANDCKGDPHYIFGYLITPEFSAYLKDFM